MLFKAVRRNYFLGEQDYLQYSRGNASEGAKRPSKGSSGVTTGGGHVPPQSGGKKSDSRVIKLLLKSTKYLKYQQMALLECENAKIF